jgi:hypothetical protein
MPWLGVLLSSLVGSAISRMLVGAGLAVATFAVLSPMVLSALNAAASSFSGIASATLQIMLISGLGSALTAIGSAMVARIAVEAAKVAVVKAS